MQPSTILIRRGLFAAILFAVIGAAIPSAIAISYGVFRRWHPDFVPSNRFHDFLSDLSAYWPYPVSGMAAFLGLSAWAAYAPRGSWSITWSLATIFGVSILSWVLIQAADKVLGQHFFGMYKGEDASISFLKGMSFLIVPPATTSHVLVLIRKRRSSGGPATLDHAPPSAFRN